MSCGSALLQMNEKVEQRAVSFELKAETLAGQLELSEEESRRLDSRVHSLENKLAAFENKKAAADKEQQEGQQIKELEIQGLRQQVRICYGHRFSRAVISCWGCRDFCFFHCG